MTVETASIPAPGDQVAVRTHDDGARGVRGVVTRIDEHAVVLRLEGARPVSPAPVLVIPVEGVSAFTPVSCVIADRQPADEDVAVFQIRRRETFRVRLPAGACVAELPDGSRTDVLNISADGIAVQVECPPGTGEHVDITLSDGETVAAGTFVVRNQRTIGTGTVVGLQADSGEDAVRGWMHDRVVHHLCAKLASESAPSAAAPPEVAAPPRETADEPVPAPASRPRKGADRRQHPRREFKSSGMTYVMESKDSRRAPIETIDISRSGVAMRSPFALEQGRRVMVVLDRETGAPWVLGRVVHCAPARDGEGGFRVGVRFIQSVLQDWPAPEPASLLRVAEDLERAEPPGARRKKRPGLSISFG